MPVPGSGQRRYGDRRRSESRSVRGMQHPHRWFEDGADQGRRDAAAYGPRRHEEREPPAGTSHGCHRKGPHLRGAESGRHPRPRALASGGPRAGVGKARLLPEAPGARPARPFQPPLSPGSPGTSRVWTPSSSRCLPARSPPRVGGLCSILLRGRHRLHRDPPQSTATSSQPHLCKDPILIKTHILRVQADVSSRGTPRDAAGCPTPPGRKAAPPSPVP